jgi:hypothetical protein
MSSIDNLKTKARFLRNAAPQPFADFFGAFAEYAEQATDILVMTPDNFQVRQGHAQQCKKLLTMLDEVKNG